MCDLGKQGLGWAGLGDIVKRDNMPVNLQRVKDNGIGLDKICVSHCGSPYHPG